MSVYVLIPLLPLLSFLTIALGGGWLKEQSHRIAVPAMLLSCILSVVACVDVIRHGAIVIPLYTLLHSGTLVIDVGLYLDSLAVVVLLLVTGVSTLVHLYSVRYMQGDPRYARFFALIALFTFSMVMLVLSNNLLVLFIFWEVMGICSYLLIGHWSERPAAVQAATKAFLVNAVADIGLGFGIIMTFATFGTLDIRQILAAAAGVAGNTVNLVSVVGLEWQVPILTLIGLCLFIGAMGKSCQLPFHGWLPSAMEAPTPVSALIHAATMVNAGVYLVIRLSDIFILAPAVMTLIAVVGAATALVGAIVALTQSDIKRILAFSTMSQIGFMMLACGVGAFMAALFHMLAHGALKAYLFLSTGGTLQAMATDHDAHDVPAPRWTLALGALALAWIPPVVIFSGQYEHLWTALHIPSAAWAFQVIALTTSFVTAFYLFRLITSVFQHPIRDEWHAMSHPQDSRPRETLDLPTLASPAIIGGMVVATVALGALLIVLWSGFAQILSPVFVPTGLSGAGIEPRGFSFAGMILPLAVALAGWGLAYYLHVRPLRLPPWAAGISKTLYVLGLNRLYADELYHAVVIRPTTSFARWLSQVVEIGGIDRMVNGTAGLSVALARWLWRVVEIRGIDRAVEGVGRQADGAAKALRKIDPRMLQHQMLIMIVCTVGAMGLLYWIVL